MSDSLNDIRQVVILTKYYSFDFGRYTIKQLILGWTKLYPYHWLPLAVTEAIYQGRLKAVSVEQILNVWLKKGAVNYNFNYEFIRLIQPSMEFRLQQEAEFQGDFVNQAENFEQMEDRIPTQVNNSPSFVERNRRKQNKDLKTTIDTIKTINTFNDFNSCKDSSQSFQKLKSLVQGTLEARG